MIRVSRPTPVRSASDIDSLFRTGRRASVPAAVLLVGPTPAHHGTGGRVAFIAGSRLGGAVVRNRAKRLLREAARQVGAPWAGLDVAFVARESLLELPLPEVVASIRRALRDAGVTA